MKTGRLLVALAVAGVFGSIAGSIWLSRGNLPLRQRIEEARSRSISTTSIRETGAPNPDFIRTAHATPSGNADGAAQRAELARVRTEIAALERQAEERRAQTEAAAAQLAANRDPRQSPVLLAHLKNRGQETPAATFETLIWAATAGGDSAVAAATTMTAETRRSAEDLIARLPPEARAQWTPEKLAALWLADATNEMKALHITGEMFTGSDAANVTFRPLGRAEDEKINLKLTPGGWKAIVPGDIIKRLERKLDRVGR